MTIDVIIELRLVKLEPRNELFEYIVCESKRVVDNSKLLMREIHGKLQYLCIRLMSHPASNRGETL